MIKKIFLSSILTLLGLTFIASGYLKLFPIEPFELNFVEQGFFSLALAPFAARFLIALEIFLGVMLILQQHIKVILKTTIALLIFFTLYLTYSIVKDGNTGNCGCFGTYLQMTPLQSIFKNIALLLVSFMLLKVKFEKKYKHKIILWLAIIASISIPFALNPPDLFVIETYDFGKVNYPLKADKFDDYNIKKIDADWEKGKKIIAFLSLTCPHCRDMAFKLHLLKKKNPSLKILFIYGGVEADKQNFLNKCVCADMPSIRMDMNDIVKISGPVFPTVVGLNNGNVIKKWSIITLTEPEANQFFK